MRKQRDDLDPVTMTIDEAASVAGVSPATMYKLSAGGKLPGCRRIGKRYVVHRATFLEWLRTGTGELADEGVPNGGKTGGR
jgi:excisionase family DNA binding protein